MSRRTSLELGERNLLLSNLRQLPHPRHQRRISRPLHQKDRAISAIQRIVNLPLPLRRRLRRTRQLSTRGAQLHYRTCQTSRSPWRAHYGPQLHHRLIKIAPARRFQQLPPPPPPRAHPPHAPPTSPPGAPTPPPHTPKQRGPRGVPPPPPHPHLPLLKPPGAGPSHPPPPPPQKPPPENCSPVTPQKPA